MSDHQFVIMWDNTGLEYIGDITQDQQRRVWDTLKGDDHKSSLPNLMHLKLRAQYNTQRHYEIYFVNAVEGITKEDIQEMFESSPQTAADTIRRIGDCFHSDRADKNKVVIV